MRKRWYSVWDPSIPKRLEPRKSMPEQVRDHATATPDKIALSFYGYDMPYKELDEAIDRLANGLIRLGIKRGDRIPLYMGNCPQFVISFFGVLRAGAIVVPLSPMFKRAELEHHLNDCGAELLIAWDSLLPQVREIGNRESLKNVIATSFWDYLPQGATLPSNLAEMEPKATFGDAIDFLDLLHESPPEPVSRIEDLREDIAALVYTSGTTGVPKGAMAAHYSFAYAVAAENEWCHLTKDDVHLGIMPFFHIGGMSAMFQPLCSGAHLVIQTRFSPESAAQAIVQYKCTRWVTITTMIIAMLEWPDLHKYDFTSLRLIDQGGAPISTEILKRLRKAVPNALVCQCYGFTENFVKSCVSPLHRPKAGYIGIPNIGTDVKIVDLQTGQREVSPNEVGQIIIKSPGVMKGYWNRPEETKEAVRGGWLYTGDLGKMDEEGYVNVEGRTKERIKASGYSVFPDEVEGLLYRHPAIAEVSVIGVPDPYRGENVKAFIVLKPEYKGKIEEDDIAAWSRENMSVYKSPRLVEFRDELPKSGAGKILRRILVEEEARKMREKGVEP